MIWQGDRSNNQDFDHQQDVVELALEGVFMKFIDTSNSDELQDSENLPRDNGSAQSHLFLSSRDVLISIDSAGHRKRKILGALKIHHAPRDLSIPFFKVTGTSFHLSKGSSMTQVPEYRLELSFIPMRSYLDDKVMSFFRMWGSSETPETSSDQCSMVYIQQLSIEPIKLKLNYRATKFDLNLLRNGDYSQLLNIFPLDGVMLHLKTLTFNGVSGLQKLLHLILEEWIKDIYQNQIHRVVSGASPFKGLSSVGSGLADLIMIPVRKKNQKVSTLRELHRSSVKVLNTIAKEVLDVSHKLADITAHSIETITNDDSKSVRIHNEWEIQPAGLKDGLIKAADSINREFHETTNILIALPIQQYHRSGPGGCVRSVVRSLPLAMLHPAAGAAEAISYTLLGLRNGLDPSAKKDDEDFWDVDMIT